MGVFLADKRSGSRKNGLPHARGGVSCAAFKYITTRRSSPRAWGCFASATRLLPSGEVFPTRVGVFLPCGHRSWLVLRLPHARGGVSSWHPFRPAIPESSPRAWGCFHFSVLSSVMVGVSSPRAWGCFRRMSSALAGMGVFPTRVGVFLGSLCAVVGKRVSSPRAWGCFSVLVKPDCQWSRESSPRAWGCFSMRGRLSGLALSLPHARGGVSRRAFKCLDQWLSSPRAWGCFYPAPIPAYQDRVFPTRVGVFLSVPIPSI